MVSKYGKHNGIKGGFLVDVTTGSIGGNGSIRLPVVSVVSGCCSIS